MVKEADNEMVFWAQNYETLRSVSTGKIRVYILNQNITLNTEADFNDQGVAKTGISGEMDIAIAEIDGDVSFIPLNYQYVGYERYWDKFREKERKLGFFTFTDRPIYKPGDKVYFKTVLRDDDDGRYSIPKGNATIYLYKDWWKEENVLQEKEVLISSDGTVDGEFILDENLETGNHGIRIKIDENNYDSVYFDVTHYRKPEYFVEVDSEKNEYIAKDKIKFNVKASYFSGTPVSGGLVTYKIYSANYYDYYYDRDRTKYLSDSYRYGMWWGEKILEDEMSLNEWGEAEVEIEAVIPKDTNKSQVYSIEVQYLDGSGNPAFRRKNVLVNSGGYSFYKKDDAMYRVKVGEEYILPLVLRVFDENENVDNVTLSGDIHRIEWIKKYIENSKYPNWEKVEENMGSVTEISDENGEVTFKYTPQHKGSYTFKIQSVDARGNLIKKEFSFYVTDKDYSYFERETNLVVNTDKDVYLPGEMAKFTISSAISDRDVFFSIDRARVNEYQVVSLDGPSATVEVKMIDDYMPNIYASVGSFSDVNFDTSSQFVEVSAIGKKMNIEIVPDSDSYGPGDEVYVEIRTSDGNGNPVAANMAFWVVDKAIFELADKNNTDIYNAFWSTRYNNTAMSHSLKGMMSSGAESGGGCFDGEVEILMSNRKIKKIANIKAGDSILTRKSEIDDELVKAKVIDVHKAVVNGYLVINGDLKITANHKMWVNNEWKTAGEIGLGDTLINQRGDEVTVESIEWLRGNFEVYNLTVEKYQTFIAEGIYVHNQKGGSERSTFEDTAYWNANVQTGSDGEANLSFKLPDNLTTWVFSSVGNSRDMVVGDKAVEVVVGKDIVVRPILPNIFRVGDKAVIKALLHNFTDDDRKFNIHFLNDEGKIKNSTHSGVLVKSNRAKEITWQVEFEEENLESEFEFLAWDTNDEKLGDNLRVSLPVKEFGFETKYAEADFGNKDYKIDFAKDSDIDKSSITLHLSSSLIQTLPTAMNYLIGYPYGCVEQTTSKLFPIVVAKENPGLFAEALKDKDVDEMVEKGVERLKSLRRGIYGGWSWWQHVDTDPFITVYVTEVLVRLKDLGYEVDDWLLDETKRYYEELPIEGNVRNQIYKLYGLSVLREVTEESITVDLSELSDDLLAMAVLVNYRKGDTNSITNGLKILESRAKEFGGGVSWSEGDVRRFGTKDASTGFVIKTLIEVGGDEDLIKKAVKYLAESRHYNYWSNTYATARVMDGLASFADISGELTANYSYVVKLDGQVIDQQNVSGSYAKELEISGAKIKEDGSLITISKNGDGEIYSTLVVNEFVKDKKAREISNGISIKREYYTERGKDDLKVGDLVTVRLIVEGLDGSYEYGLIEDRLPAGLIAINERLKNEQGLVDSKKWRGYSGEVTEQGKIIYVNRLGQKSNVYDYKARVVSEGQYYAPPAEVHLMYKPEVFGRSRVDLVNIGKGVSYLDKNFDDKEDGKQGRIIWLFVILIGAVNVIVLCKIIRKKKTFKIFNFKRSRTGIKTEESIELENKIDEKIN
jgi:uncharacterized protein YfaS (alpha-2-macroglobulin family)